MAILPRPVSPRSALSDLMGFLREERPYKPFVLIASIMATSLIIYTFILDGRQIVGPRGPEIIYFENWRADRPTSATLEQLKRDVVKREAAIAAKQEQFQKAADLFGIEWREDQARNDARRRQDMADVMHALDVRLAQARASEAAAADAGASKAGAPRGDRP